MDIYIYNYLSCYIYIFVTKIFKKKKIIFFFYIIQLIFLVVLRKETVGIDTVQYLKFYNFITNFQSLKLSRFEVGFKYINYILKYILGNFQYLLIFMGVLTLIPLYFFILRYSKNYFLSIITYMSFNYYYYDFITLRQSAAYSLVLLSYKYIENKSFWKFLLLIFLASSFHKSALIFIIAYYLLNQKIDNKKVGISFICLFIFYILRAKIGIFIINKFYANYLLENSNSYNFFLFFIFIFIGLYLNNKKMLTIDYRMNMFYVSFLVGTILMIGTGIFSNMLRVSNYYTQVIIILIPNFLETIKNKKLKLLSKIIFFITSFLLFLYLMRDGERQMMKYYFFWQK